LALQLQSQTQQLAAEYQKVGAAIAVPNSKVGCRISNKLALQLQSQTQRLAAEYLTSWRCNCRAKRKGWLQNI
jgi:hypothetical protein